MNKLLIISIFFCLSGTGLAQDKEDIVLSVLSKNVVGKTFRFKLSDNKDYLNEVDVAYLGEIETIAKKKYYIVTWGRVWGPNKHTTGSILLYDNKKQYFGNYVLGEKSFPLLRILHHHISFVLSHAKFLDLQYTI